MFSNAFLSISSGTHISCIERHSLSAFWLASSMSTFGMFFESSTSVEAFSDPFRVPTTPVWCQLSWPCEKARSTFTG